MDWKVRVVKRCVDVALASVALAIVLPFFPLVAMAIRLESKGPVFYWQRRAGRFLGREVVGGVPRYRFVEFDMPKFRTMRADAEVATGPVLARVGDPRVTRIGRVLRRTRIDELPQFWCVLRGQMSLIGPRPERPEMLDNLANAIPYFEERMRDVKPGITGLAQINLGYTGAALPGTEAERVQEDMVNPFDLDAARGADADDMRIKLLYDLGYAAALDSLRTYLRLEGEILVKTPLAMVRGTGR